MKTLITFLSILFIVGTVFGQTYTENFDQTGNWAGGSAVSYTTKTYTLTSPSHQDHFSSNKSVKESSYTNSSGFAWRLKKANNTYLRYECEGTVSSFSIYAARWDNSPSPNVTVRYSINSGTSYTNLATFTGSSFTGNKVYKQLTYTLPSAITNDPGKKIYIEFLTTSGERMLYDDFSVDFQASNTPTINLSETSLSGFSYNDGNGPSSEQTFTVDGSNLTNDISIIPPTDYEISTGSGGSFVATSPITLTQSGGSVATTTIYTRLKAGLSVGAYNNEDITASSTGATDKTVSCSGDVNTPPPPTISLSETSLSGFSYSVGNGPSSEQTFTVEGSNLTNDISIASPTDYEISTATGGSFVATSPITLTQSGGTVSSTTIYVRLKSGLSDGAYNNEDITASSSGATDKSVSCNGDVNTPPTTTIPYSQDFASDLGDCSTYSVSGTSKVWNQNSGVAQMNGYNSGDLEEDWLIIPGIDFDSYSGEEMTFNTEYKYGSDNSANYLKLMYSSNYSGVGDPSSATWTELSFTKPSSSETQTSSGTIDLSSVSGSNVYLAFKYHYSSGNYRRWYVDDISIIEHTIKAEPTNHASGFAVTTTSTTHNEITLTWSDNDGAVAADKYLIKASDVGYANISNPSDGTEEVDATLVKNIAHGTETVTFTGLTASTTYYFQIYPYTNSGSAIDYKVSSSIPQATETTDIAPAGPSGLVITEVCGNYADGDNGNKNGFAEIYNPTSQTIDLTNVQLRYYNNSSSVTATVNLSGTLASGEYVIVTQDLADFSTYYGISADYEDNAFYFNGGSDAIDLYDNSSKGSVISQFNKPSSGNWSWNDNNDYELNSYTSDGGLQASWNSLNRDTGTPKGDNSTLPIELLSFNAFYANKAIELSWQTATEINNDFFTIERSIDAEHFEAIGKVRGAGNSNIVKSYAFEDANAPSKKVIYYRLKQTDYDGSFTYSNIVSINTNADEFSILNTYQEADGLNINISSPDYSAMNIEVYSLNGQLVINKNAELQKGQNRVQLDISTLPQAVYLVRFISGSFIKTQKVFIQ